jgi:hypothetical protein
VKLRARRGRVEPRHPQTANEGLDRGRVELRDLDIDDRHPAPSPTTFNMPLTVLGV